MVCVASCLISNREGCYLLVAVTVFAGVWCASLALALCDRSCLVAGVDSESGCCCVLVSACVDVGLVAVSDSASEHSSSESSEDPELNESLESSALRVL